MLTSLKQIKELISPILFAIVNSDRRDNIEYTLGSHTRWVTELTVNGSKQPLYKISISYMATDIEIINIWYKGGLVESGIKIDSDHSSCIHNYLVEAILELENKLKIYWKSQQKLHSNQ